MNDLDTYEENLSLYKLIETPAVETLKIVSEAYHNQRIEGSDFKLPTILITSPMSGLGSETISKAFSNSLGNQFKVGISEFFVSGESLYDYFEEEKDNLENITFYIRGNLQQYQQSLVYRLIKEKILNVPIPYKQKMRQVEYKRSPLLILSVRSQNDLVSYFRKLFDYQINLKPYNQDQIVQILQMRCRFYRIEASVSSLQYIAQNCLGNSGRAAQLLTMAMAVMRSQDKGKLSLKEVEKALVLGS